ncbi:hypothetical protein CDAR_391281 [Caerostris darwini]|uniref:Uncharacterized protein n=1 Tax=Caerostris darwini TaxID=1538125 RepID=A0AAV4NY72_9ARAC|nr:hypothetical protein CDAR_391281 [Caerostris darwini]
MASNVSEESSLIMCDSRNMEEKEILVDNLRAVNITLPDSESSICTEGLARCMSRLGEFTNEQLIKGEVVDLIRCLEARMDFIKDNFPSRSFQNVSPKIAPNTNVEKQRFYRTKK